MSGLPERVAFSFVGPGKGPFSSMPGKGGREPVMAEAEDGKNGQQSQEGQGGEPEPIDYKAKYEAMKSHSREWERKAKENQGAADELEKLKAENLSELEKAQQRAKAAEDETARLKADRERADAVSQVADEANVPVEFVSMLSGKDADELAGQVKRALEILPAYPARTDDGGTGGAAKKKDNADRFYEGLFGE